MFGCAYFHIFRDEYDFLPVLEPTHNRNPVLVIDHKLGLELWAAKLVFHYAYVKVMAWRMKKPHSKHIGEYLNTSYTSFPDIRHLCFVHHCNFMVGMINHDDLFKTGF